MFWPTAGDLRRIGLGLSESLLATALAWVVVHALLRHRHIEGVFDENRVQVISPYDRSDPPEPQVPPRAQWSPALAPRRMLSGPPAEP